MQPTPTIPLSKPLHSNYSTQFLYIGENGARCDIFILSPCNIKSTVYSKLCFYFIRKPVNYSLNVNFLTGDKLIYKAKNRRQKTVLQLTPYPNLWGKL